MKTKSPSSTSSSEHGADREGLIGLPGPDAPRTASGLRWGVSLAFLFVLGATAVCDTLFPAPRPRMALHQELDYEAMRERANLRDGSAARLVEYELRLTSRVRRALAKPYSTFLYEVLGETPHNVIRGDDDWLFMRERVIPPARSTAARREPRRGGRPRPRASRGRPRPADLLRADPAQVGDAPGSPAARHRLSPGRRRRGLRGVARARRGHDRPLANLPRGRRGRHLLPLRQPLVRRVPGARGGSDDPTHRPPRAGGSPSHRAAAGRRDHAARAHRPVAVHGRRAR